MNSASINRSGTQNVALIRSQAKGIQQWLVANKFQGAADQLAMQLAAEQGLAEAAAQGEWFWVSDIQKAVSSKPQKTMPRRASSANDADDMLIEQKLEVARTTRAAPNARGVLASRRRADIESDIEDALKSRRCRQMPPADPSAKKRGGKRPQPVVNIATSLGPNLALQGQQVHHHDPGASSLISDLESNKSETGTAITATVRLAHAIVASAQKQRKLAEDEQDKQADSTRRVQLVMRDNAKSTQPIERLPYRFKSELLHSSKAELQRIRMDYNSANSKLSSLVSSSSTKKSFTAATPAMPSLAHCRPNTCGALGA